MKIDITHVESDTDAMTPAVFGFLKPADPTSEWPDHEHTVSDTSRESYLDRHELQLQPSRAQLLRMRLRRRRSWETRHHVVCVAFVGAMKYTGSPDYGSRECEPRSSISIVLRSHCGWLPRKMFALDPRSAMCLGRLVDSGEHYIVQFRVSTAHDMMASASLESDLSWYPLVLM